MVRSFEVCSWYACGSFEVGSSMVEGLWCARGGRLIRALGALVVCTLTFYPAVLYVHISGHF